MVTEKSANSIEIGIDMDQPSASLSTECVICSQSAHGVHFGILSCRACAAFFRRTIVLDKKYTCRRANSQCNINKSERYLCRMCRYNKCIKLGMTPDNVQWNRDTLSGSSGKASPSPEKTSLPGSRKNRLKEKPALYDLTSVMRHVQEIFEEKGGLQIPNDNPEYSSLNTLEKMDWALRHYRKGQKTHNIGFKNSMKLAEMVRLWGEQSSRVASWLMHSESFRNISLEEKFAVFKLTWLLWQRFERLTMAVQIFGQRTLDEKIMLVSDTHAINMNMVDLDLSKISDYPAATLRNMFSPFSSRLFDDVAKPMLELELTTIEQSYMLCQLLWHTSGKSLQGVVLEAGESFVEEIGNNLHEYYTKKQKTGNYAARLIKIMSVVNSFQKVQMERQNIVELANVFDVFKAKIFDPTVFGAITG